MPINKEILIYHNIPYSKYRWISYITLTQATFLFINLFLIATPKLIEERRRAMSNYYIKVKVEDDDEYSHLMDERYVPNPDYKPLTLQERIIKTLKSDIFTLSNLAQNFKERPFYCSGIVIASTSVGAACTFYARRMVHQITLLPGDRVRMDFFNPFPWGKPIAKTIPLKDVSCQLGRKSSKSYSILRLRNHWGYHLVHKKEGEFLEPKLYDRYLGYSRSWSK